MNCRGDEDIDAKRSRPSIGKPVMGHARKERVVLFGTDQRITSGPAAKRPHSKAEYMTAPERFADSQIPLAPRAPSIQDPIPTSAGSSSLRYGDAVLTEMTVDARCKRRGKFSRSSGGDMPKRDYAAFRALDPFFAVVMEGL